MARVQLLARLTDRSAARALRRDGMVGDRERARWVTQWQAALLELIELRGREVGEELPVDEDQAEVIAQVVNQMAIPDFVEQCLAHASVISRPFMRSKRLIDAARLRFSNACGSAMASTETRSIHAEQLEGHCRLPRDCGSHRGPGADGRAVLHRPHPQCDRAVSAGRLLRSRHPPDGAPSGQAYRRRPNVVVQNQPSAGGIGLASRFASGADSDGSVIGPIQRAVPQYAFVGVENARFDPLKINWIGSLSSYANDSYLLVINAKHPATTVEGLRKPGIKTQLGSGRSGSANLLYALVARDVLKMNYTMVRGYGGTAPILLAQERGEVDGLFIDYSTVQTSALDQWRSKKIVPVVQIGRKTRLPELSDVPLTRDLVTDAADREFLEFAELPFFIALPFAAPAGMPADRLKAIRDGFMALATDREFLADARKMNYEVSPVSGEQVVAAIAEASKASAAVKERFKALVSQ